MSLGSVLNALIHDVGFLYRVRPTSTTVGDWVREMGNGELMGKVERC